MNIIYGIMLAVTAGAMNGLFALPMKLTRAWAWENIWLPFSILTLLIFPWLIAFITISDLVTAIGHVSLSYKIIGIVWGAAVYSGSLMFGISLSYIGTALGFALLVGSMSIVGILCPILIFNQEFLWLSGGKWILAGIFLLLITLVLNFRAGRLKEIAQGGENTSGIGDKTPRSALVGMILAIAGGMLSGLLSLGMNMTWAKGITSAATMYGSVAANYATFLTLAFVLSGGFIPNTLYCIIKLTKNRTWQRYQKRSTCFYWVMILIMGIMYSGSLALWGISISENMLGPLGPSVGWAFFIGTIVIASSMGGFATGEWKNAGKKAIIYLSCSLLLIVFAMIAIGYGNFLIQ